MILSALLLGLTPSVFFQELEETKPEQNLKEHQELATAKVRRGLRNLVDDFGHLGLGDEMVVLRTILLELGDTPEDHKKLQKSWQKALAKEKSKGNERTKNSLSKKLQKIVSTLNKELGKAEDATRIQFAKHILSLDNKSEDAHKVMGHILDNGEWISKQGLQWAKGAAQLSELEQRSRALKFDSKKSPSENPIALELYKRDAQRISTEKLILHGGSHAEKLRGIVRDVLRARALSEELGISSSGSVREFVLVENESDYELALEEALENKGLSPREYENQKEILQGWFHDNRGWTTLKDQTSAKSIVFFFSSFMDSYLNEWQSCFAIGYLNWICLKMFFQEMPTLFTWEAFEDDSGKTVSLNETISDSVLLRSASRSFYGGRLWLSRRARAGYQYPYSLAMRDNPMEVSFIPALKATVMNEFLLIRGDLPKLIEQTKDKSEKRIGQIESALGQTLPSLEADWTLWLLGETISPGLIQRLVDANEIPNVDGDAMASLEKLKGLRAEAYRNPLIPHESISLEEGISGYAQIHARYLVLNPEQQTAWPDAHEEYPDREGFSPGGNWAGQHSVIDFQADPVEAINRWMATFYHRLPLLEPGLFGVGYGNEGSVTVLDTVSLVAPHALVCWVVWPATDAINVPLRFQPELPNPVPGEDQSKWGYPITLQAHMDRKDVPPIEMSLHLGKETEGALVSCHYLTPRKPFLKELAPANTYCLIPKATLTPNKTYTVVARCPETNEERIWSFTTGH